MSDPRTCIPGRICGGAALFDEIERLTANISSDTKAMLRMQAEIERIKKLLKETIDVEIEQVDEIKRLTVDLEYYIHSYDKQKAANESLLERIAKLEAVANSLITDLALCEVKLEEALESK